VSDTASPAKKPAGRRRRTDDTAADAPPSVRKPRVRRKAATADAATRRVAVVTGATGGLGRWVALGLAAEGCRVILLGRNPDLAADTLRWIEGRVPGAAPEFIQADLSRLSEVRAAAEQVLARAPAVDILLNNAGLVSGHYDTGADGHELTMTVNHLAPILLCELLLPALRRAAAERGEARIVNVGSTASDRARLDPDRLDFPPDGRDPRWGMVRAYSRSKLALMMASFALARREADSGVSVNVVHPGVVATGLVRTSDARQWGWRVMAPFILTEAQGADTPLFAAIDPSMTALTGAYLKRRRPAVPNRMARDPALCERVLRATEALFGGAPPPTSDA
jgi:NAD(P)-dependent dehydrogenase (short-subunit alcohol dehydrogenase family)